MAKTVVEVPDERVSELEAYKDRLGELLLLGLSQIRIQEVLLLYQRGLVSFGRAAELAGLPEQEMIRQARAFGVQPRWTEKMVAEEMAGKEEKPKVKRKLNLALAKRLEEKK